MVFIYVLQLEQDKWYIGKTNTNLILFKIRIETLFDSNGSEFTKTYKPLEVYEIIPECDKYDEDKYVRKYMDKYGIDNVRGGTYSRLELTVEEQQLIQKELWGTNDLCFLCGGDHFIKDCPNNKQEEKPSEEILEDEVLDTYIIDTDLLKLIQDRITSEVGGLTPEGLSLQHYYFEDTPYSNSITKKAWTIYGRDLINRIHIEEYFNLDNITISEYINNNDEIMNLYKRVVKLTCSELCTLNNKQISFTPGINNLKYIQYNKILKNIEKKINDLIVDICYLTLHNIIISKYNENYILTNFKMKKNILKIFSIHNNIHHRIYFNYYMEDYWKLYFPTLSEQPGISNDIPVLRKKSYGIQYMELIDVNITGELYYSANPKVPKCSDPSNKIFETNRRMGENKQCKCRLRCGCCGVVVKIVTKNGPSPTTWQHSGKCKKGCDCDGKF